MAATGWRRSPLHSIPGTNDEEWWAQWARDPGYGRRWHSIGEHFGISGFGVNAYEADAGEELVVPHDEVEFGGQEELYAVVRGAARFLCDGETVEVGEGELLFVGPEVSREARATADGTLVLMVGGTPGKPYGGSG